MAAYAAPQGMGVADVLKTVFHHYSAFGRTHADLTGTPTLDNSGFAKMCACTLSLSRAWLKSSPP